LSNKWRIFQRPLNVSPDFEIVIVKASVVLHSFVRERDGYKFEDALTVTGLEDVHDGQSVLVGFTVNRWWSCFLADVKNMNSRLHKITKKHVCMNFNQLCSINYGNTQQRRFLTSPRASKFS
jgi:hypothetical protein